jgi:NAD(P)-dependent dehydrogenase (short-subunit alcohol dehydrogenase family)
MSIAIVTGTSTGIGLSTAITLARAGHRVFAGMRNLDRGAELREIISAEKLPITVIQLDVDDDGSVDKAFKQVIADNGRIDVLVNNAGVSGGGPVEEVPVAVFRRAMETNFFGSLRCIKAVLPGMRSQRSGCIVNVTSIAGRFGAAAQSPYAASKWALEALSESLAQEMKAFNVRVAIVEPGVIATPMTMVPRTTPPESPYPFRRRRDAMFTAALRSPTPPAVVADQIRGIVESDSWQLRYPSGPDAAKTLQWRKNMSDEEWVSFGAASDAEWVAEMKKRGLDVKL